MPVVVGHEPLFVVGSHLLPPIPLDRDLFLDLFHDLDLFLDPLHDLFSLALPRVVE